jgi:TP901 family phage tail tape measure protein
MKDMVANVRELDKAQVELRKVTNLSGQSLKDFTNEAYQMGSKVAKTGTEIVQASTEFAKMGYDPKQALGLSELASRFQNIADTEISAAESAKFINSQLKAFGKTDSLQKFTGDFEKAQHVIDATNEVANNFAVGTNDLQNALTKAGSAMSVAGNSFEETIAMVTAGTEIMVGQPAKVGRGLRTIAINISKLAQEQETLSIANGKYTISLQDQNGEMLSTFDIMSQIGDVWGNLNETEQTALATQLAGKTQFEVFTNVMKNWETVVGNGADKVGALQTALNSNGSSMRENEKYLDSIEGKIQAFRSAWEQLSFHLVNSDLIKNVVDLGTKIITVIDNIVQKIGALPTALGALGVAFGAKKLLGMAEGFLGISKGIEGVTEGAEALAGASQAASGTKGLGGLVSSLKFLTNPVVLGGLATLAGTIALMEIDKYFSLDSSIKRLDEYKNKLQSTTDEIEALKKKRDSDEGLTNAEKTHLAVLEAEERSLERQIELEKQRVQTAFKKDASSTRGKRDEASGRHGPDELLNYQDARKKELDLDKQIVDVENRIADARKKAQYYRMTGDDEGASTWEAQAQAYEKQLEKLGEQYVELDADAAEASANLAAYWEEVSANVDYDSLADAEKEVYDNIHKAFIESQIDASNLKDSYTDVANVLNSAMDSLGHDNLNLFDNIDISSIQTVEDAVNAIKEQIEGLDDDAEITFSVKDENGDIEEITKKVSEITDEDIEAIVHFNADGVGEVEAEVDNAAKDKDATVHVSQEGAQAVSGVIDDAAKKRDSDIKVSQTGASTAKSDIDSAAKNRTTIINVIARGIQAVKNALSGIPHAKGKRKGEPGGMAWLGDEGTASNPKPELVVGEDGAYLAGTSGWELHSLKDSDTVYSYSETKKLLGGKQTFAGFVNELPRYKKGKKKNAKTWEKEFDEKLETLQHKAKANHWTDAEYQAEYKKLYDSYVNKATTAQLRSYIEDREDYENQVATDSFKRRIGNIGMGYGNLADLVSDINANADLSADEKIDAIADAYKASVEYNLKEYENGKNTRDKVVQDIKNYYATRGEYDEDYYKMLDDLREADQKKEVKRLKELSKQQENKLSLAQKYLNKELDSIEKQIDAQKEEAEAQEKLIELQNDLNKAKSTSIRIYKEGVGFVYEQDTEAIKEAQKALDEYTSSQTKSELEQRADAIKEVLQLFEDLQDASDIHELELTLGVSSLSGLTGGNLGTNLSKWSDWIKGVIVSQIAYSDLNEQIGNLSGADIDKWLGDVLSGGSHQISNTTLSEYLSKHSFANGTLSAPGGLSRVGENLNGELVWLGKGDSVYSNGISKNLMQWGRYNPAQVLSSNNHSSQQVFNFDKIVLPNVRNAEDFYRELQKLPNMAIQQSTRR